MAFVPDKPTAGIQELAGSADEVIRSEPGLGWILAQALYVAQPFLEAFWTGDQISRLAESWESGARTVVSEASAGAPEEPT